MSADNPLGEILELLPQDQVDTSKARGAANVAAGADKAASLAPARPAEPGNPIGKLIKTFVPTPARGASTAKAAGTRASAAAQRPSTVSPGQAGANGEGAGQVDDRSDPMLVRVLKPAHAPTWRSSSHDLLTGLIVRDVTETIPDGLFDNLFFDKSYTGPERRSKPR
ncbi:MAG: hypothetical protein ABIV63_04845 [Caldimonas sp.]